MRNIDIFNLLRTHNVKLSDGQLALPMLLLMFKANVGNIIAYYDYIIRSSARLPPGGRTELVRMGFAVHGIYLLYL